MALLSEAGASALGAAGNTVAILKYIATAGSMAELESVRTAVCNLRSASATVTAAYGKRRADLQRRSPEVAVAS